MPECRRWGRDLRRRGLRPCMEALDELARRAARTPDRARASGEARRGGGRARGRGARARGARGGAAARGGARGALRSAWCCSPPGSGRSSRCCRDPAVDEVMVNGPRRRVRRARRAARARPAWRSLARPSCCTRSSASSRRSAGASTRPRRSATRGCADGSRVNVVIPPLSLVGPCLTVRRFRREGFSLRDLVANGTLPGGARRVPGAVRGGARVGARQRRHRLGQDDHAERALGRDPGRRAHRDDRGRRRAAPAPAPRGAARGAAGEPRGPRRGDDPAARAQRAAHAPRPHRGRRGARRRGARHAAGAEHGPRRLADDGARQLAARTRCGGSRRSR